MNEQQLREAMLALYGQIQKSEIERIRLLQKMNELERQIFELKKKVKE